MVTRGRVNNMAMLRPGRTAIKRKREYSKMILLVVLAFALLSGVTSYILAATGSDTNSEVTVAIISTLAAAVVGYLVKSAADHNSANKYGVDLVDEVTPEEEDYNQW